MLSPIERFWKKVIIQGKGYNTPCWIWIASTNSQGYGHINISGRIIASHRWAYEHFIGNIPRGLELDHLCRNILCVNPSHCRAVTHKVNILCGNSPAAINTTKTHCPHGHPYNKENTFFIKYNGGRRCRICMRNAWRIYRENNKSSINEYKRAWREKQCKILK